MSGLYISPERIFLIYSRVEDEKEVKQVGGYQIIFDMEENDIKKENKSSFGYVKYKLVSATTNEARADEEIKKNPSGLMKKVINFQKEIVLPKTEFELHVKRVKWEFQ